MQQNDALVSLNSRLVAMGMRARKRRVGVQPLPREIVRRERRVFAMRSPDNREDGRGILTKGRSRAKLLVEPLLPCGRRGRKRLPARLFPNLGENPLARHPAGARPPKSIIATLAPSSMAQPRALKTSPVTQVLS